jgi:hypothetical protein
VLVRASGVDGDDTEITADVQLAPRPTAMTREEVLATIRCEPTPTRGQPVRPHHAAVSYVFTVPPALNTYSSIRLTTAYRDSDDVEKP